MGQRVVALEVGGDECGVRENPCSMAGEVVALSHEPREPRVPRGVPFFQEVLSYMYDLVRS